MKKLLLTAIATAALSGCTDYYAYKGKVYGLSTYGDFSVYSNIAESQKLPRDELFSSVLRDGKRSDSYDIALGDANSYQTPEEKKQEEEQIRLDEIQEAIQDLDDVVGTSEDVDPEELKKQERGGT